jgi:hypothetical protein
MTTARSPLELPTIRRGRAVTILLLICSGFTGVPLLLAGLAACALGVPFTDAIYFMLTLFGVASLTVVVVWRWRGYLVRGQLVSDVGKEPKRKLFAWLAAISLIAGVVVVEAVRREAEIAPVHGRIQQLIELWQPILNRTQNLLDRQRALLAVVPPDAIAVQHLGQLLEQEQGESRGFGKLIELEVAEEHRLVFRLLPEWSEVQQSLNDLREGLANFPSHPWTFLASKHALQLYISVFAFANGLISLLIAMGHRQIRENGIWQGGLLVRWKLIGSYRWERDTLIAFIGKTHSSITLPIAQADKQAVEGLLASRLSATQ